MQSGTQSATVSKTQLWAGRILSALAALFLLFDGDDRLRSLIPLRG